MPLIPSMSTEIYTFFVCACAVLVVKARVSAASAVGIRIAMGKVSGEMPTQRYRQPGRRNAPIRVEYALSPALR